jgi:hypothetical protein
MTKKERFLNSIERALKEIEIKPDYFLCNDLQNHKFYGTEILGIPVLYSGRYNLIITYEYSLCCKCNIMPLWKGTEDRYKFQRIFYDELENYSDTIKFDENLEE